jgi:cell division protein FtsL
MNKPHKRNQRDDGQPKTVRPPSRLPRGWWAGALVILALGIAALVHVRAKHAVVQLGYALSLATTEHEHLVADQRKLQVEVATLRSPPRLRQLATERLGLVEPDPTQILRLDGESQGSLALRSGKNH